MEVWIEVLTPKQAPFVRATAHRTPKVLLYRALDPAAGLKRHHPQQECLKKLGLTGIRPIVVFRTEETFASYLMGKASDKEPVVGPVIDELPETGVGMPGGRLYKVRDASPRDKEPNQRERCCG